jgi:formylglycine-generating enzyme required for sulfatase activity
MSFRPVSTHLLAGLVPQTRDLCQVPHMRSASIPASASQANTRRVARNYVAGSAGVMALTAIVSSVWFSPVQTTRVDAALASMHPSPPDEILLAHSEAARELPLQMLHVPAGSFRMGSFGDEAQVRPFELPLHEVRVPAFEICAFEVTRGQWRELMDQAPTEWSSTGDDDALPATHVRWEDARAFCERLSDQAALVGTARYRLPSEAEWEYACRAGSTLLYSFGNDTRRLREHGWFFANSGDVQLDANASWVSRKVFGEWGCRLHAVGGKLPNAWGIYDMHGNVWEWCEDTGHPSYDGAPTDGSAWVDPNAITRVARGGCFSETAAGVRSAYRFSNLPAQAAGEFLGFRPVRTPSADHASRD